MGKMSIIELLHQQRDSDLIYNALPRTLMPGYRFGPHCHENIEICLMQEGECDILINGETMTVHAGEMMVISPHMIHSFHMTTSQPATFLQAHFFPNDLFEVSADTRKVMRFIAYMMEPTSAWMFYPYTPEMLNCVERICRLSAEENRPNQNMLAHLYISELVLLLSEAQANDYRRVFPNVSSDLVTRAVQFISYNLGRRIKLRDVAEHCAVSTRHLATVFREQFNLTVNDYINLAKMDTAMWRLARNKTDISEISAMTGYPSPQYFATVFKKYTGVTPREYRARDYKDV